MKKIKFKVWVLVLVALMVNVNVEAQGLIDNIKALGNNAKNKKVKTEASSSDPRASVTTVEEGYTKSPADIRKAYNRLDNEFYFFPYSHPNLRNYYLLDDSKEEMDFFNQSCRTVDENMRVGNIDCGYLKSLHFGGMVKCRYYHFIEETIPSGNKGTGENILESTGVTPIGIHPIYAGFALFEADPAGLKPFMRYCEARNAAKGMESVHIGQGDYIFGKTVMTKDGKKELPISWNEMFPEKLYKKDNALRDLVKRKTPIGVIKEATTYYNDQIKKCLAAKDYANTRYYSHLFEHAMFLWEEKEGTSGADFKTFYAEKVKYEKEYKDWMRLELASSAPIEMPKTYTENADLTARILVAAKRQAESEDPPFNVDKVVFTSGDWSINKDGKFPYDVVSRTRYVAFLTNENGQWMIRYAQVQQNSNGTGGWKDGYGFIYIHHADKIPQPVDYKP